MESSPLHHEEQQIQNETSDPDARVLGTAEDEHPVEKNPQCKSSGRGEQHGEDADATQVALDQPRGSEPTEEETEDSRGQKIPVQSADGPSNTHGSSENGREGLGRGPPEAGALAPRGGDTSGGAAGIQGPQGRLRGEGAAARERSDLSTHSSLASGSLHRVTTGLTAESPLYEENDSEVDSEEDEPGEHGEEDDVTVLPWHHEQLYRLYGKHVADGFLHPKFETAKRVVAASRVSIKQHRKGVSAGELWEDLRNESRMRLQRREATLHPELKVADLHRLLDESRMRAAQELRRKVELQYRMSCMNEDRVSVLLFNNPPPTVELHSPDQGPARYLLPDWRVHREPSDDGSVWSYEKWLTQPPGERTKGGGSPRLDPLEAIAGSTPDRHQETRARHVKGRPGATPRLPRIAFLTEREAARSPGAFSARHRRAAEEWGRPPPLDPLKRSATSAAQDSLNRQSASQQSNVPDADKRDPQESRGSWPPLSLAALTGYKRHLPVLGSGEFNQGKTPMWKTQAAAL